MNTNNSSTKDFKDIVLTDELKKIIKIASKFVAKNDFREQLKYVYIVNYNEKLAIISTDGHALFKYETDIDMLVSECTWQRIGIELYLYVVMLAGVSTSSISATP